MIYIYLSGLSFNVIYAGCYIYINIFFIIFVIDLLIYGFINIASLHSLCARAWFAGLVFSCRAQRAFGVP